MAFERQKLNTFAKHQDKSPRTGTLKLDCQSTIFLIKLNNYGICFKVSDCLMVWNNFALAIKRHGSKFQSLEEPVCCISNLIFYEAEFMVDAKIQSY